MKARQFIEDLDLKGRRVLIRVDFNVPLDENQKITDNARIAAALPSIRRIIKSGGKCILMSHLGRPLEGKWTEQASMAPIAARLSELIGRDVLMARDWRQVAPLPGDLVLLELSLIHI